MKNLAIQAIESIPALERIAEIQQRISELENLFGFKNSSNKFQSTLESELEKLEKMDATKNIKPIEQFLAENKVLPVNENAAANAKKVAQALQLEDNLAVVDSFNPSVSPNTESRQRVENSSPTSTEGMIEAAARHFGVDSDLVKAIATAESNMNQDARSYVGAIGVMQLMPETAGSLGVDPYDEKQNIEGGAHYIRQMLDKFNGNVKYAIAAYNAGPGAVQKYGGIPPYSETQEYVGRVMDYYVK